MRPRKIAMSQLASPNDLLDLETSLGTNDTSIDFIEPESATVQDCYGICTIPCENVHCRRPKVTINHRDLDTVNIDTTYFSSSPIISEDNVKYMIIDELSTETEDEKKKMQKMRHGLLYQSIRLMARRWKETWHRKVPSRQSIIKTHRRTQRHKRELND